MTTYAIRRLLLVVPVVFGAMTVLFLLFFVIPGDPVELLAGAEGRSVPEPTRRAIEARFGLDQPLYQQYLDYWVRTLQFDLGESYVTRRDVSETLGRTAAASARLTLWAVTVEIVIGLTAGVVSAIRRYSFLDSLVTVSTAAASAIPVFVLGYLFQQAFAVFPNQNDWPDWARFPAQGIGPDTWSLFVIPRGEQWRYLLFPAVTLASVSTALVARMTRTTMLEVSQADFMRTARAKGVPERKVIVHHGLRNALIPVVTLIGIDIGVLMGSAVLTETVYNWPGLGSTIVNAIGRRDAPVVMGLVLVLVVIYVLINLIVDLSYGLFDPRIRYGDEGGT